MILPFRYERFVYRDYVSSHPELKFCVGKDCPVSILTELVFISGFSGSNPIKGKESKKGRLQQMQNNFLVRF